MMVASRHNQHEGRPRVAARYPPHASRHTTALLLAMALFCALAAVPVGAQQPAITMDVAAGYEGAYRIGEWFPVTVNIANDGPDVQGVLEWSFSQSGREAFAYTVDLPRSSRKRITLNVFSHGFARNGRLRLRAGHSVLAEHDVQLDAVDGSHFLIGVISSDPALLNSLAALQFPNGVSVRHLDAATLPGQVAPLRSLNVLFLHDSDTSALTQEQREALDGWVRLGGQLVVSGGIDAARTTSALRDLLPIEITGRVVQGDLTPLTQFTAASAAAPTGVALNEVRLRPGARVIPSASTAAPPLIVQQRPGNGSVTFTTFDLASLRGWVGEPALWQRVLDQNEIPAPGARARQQSINLLQNVLRLPSLALPSGGILLAFLLIYILAVGPGTYVVLRRIRRLEWAWLTLPVTMLAFATLFYLVGLGLRGDTSQLNQVAIVQGFEGQPRGLATAFIGLFSPRRARYTLSFGPAALISEAGTWSDDRADGVPVVGDGVDVQVRDVLIDVGSVRTFIAETAVDVPLSVQSALRLEGQHVRGEVRNTGAATLEDALIVHGNSFQRIGSLAPNASGQVDLDDSTDNFPWGVGLVDSGRFNRQQVLSDLFNNLSINNQRVYLLAWQSHPAVPVQINQQPAPQEALTLYVVQLNV